MITHGHSRGYTHSTIDVIIFFRKISITLEILEQLRFSALSLRDYSKTLPRFILVLLHKQDLMHVILARNVCGDHDFNEGKDKAFNTRGKEN